MDDPVPEELGFYCGTEPEMLSWSFALFLSAAQMNEVDLGINVHVRLDDKTYAENERRTFRLLFSEFESRFQISPTIFYHNRSSCRSAFPSGSREVLTSSIANIGMVSEGNLTWEQVLEFREDREARMKYQRLVRWMDAELKESSPKEVEDAIAIRLDD